MTKIRIGELTFCELDYWLILPTSFRRHLERDVHHVAETFPDLLADVFSDSDDMARRPHADDLPVVWHPIEGGMDQESPFAEHRLDVERHLDVGRIHTFVLENDGIEFKRGSIHW